MKIFMDIKQISELLELAKDNPRDFALFHMAFNTGFRISDLLAIEKLQVSPKKGIIVMALRIKMKKTDNWIDKPLRDDCRRALNAYLKTRRDRNPFLFPAAGGSKKRMANLPMNRMYAHRLYKRYLSMIYDSSMLCGAATHTPRRSMGKIISQLTGRIEPASKWLGHSSVIATSAYIDMAQHEEKANQVMGSLDF